jgi:hypothetical protein
MKTPVDFSGSFLTIIYEISSIANRYFNIDMQPFLVNKMAFSPLK